MKLPYIMKDKPMRDIVLNKLAKVEAKMDKIKEDFKTKMFPLNQESEMLTKMLKTLDEYSSLDSDEEGEAIKHEIPKMLNIKATEDLPLNIISVNTDSSTPEVVVPAFLRKAHEA